MITYLELNGSLCKEYFQSQKLKFEGDFSYLDEFRKLKIGVEYLEICEGFGLYGVGNVNNESSLSVIVFGAAAIPLMYIFIGASL